MTIGWHFLGTSSNSCGHTLHSLTATQANWKQMINRSHTAAASSPAAIISYPDSQTHPTQGQSVTGSTSDGRCCPMGAGSQGMTQPVWTHWIRFAVWFSPAGGQFSVHPGLPVFPICSFIPPLTHTQRSSWLVNLAWSLISGSHD